MRNRADLFERHGGHAQAAGFTILNSNIEALREHLLNWQGNGTTVEVEVVEVPDVATVAVVTEQEASQLSTTHMVDIVINKPEKQLTYDVYTKIGMLSPFGAGNPEPVFRLDGARLIRRWTNGPEGRHLRIRLRHNDRQFDGTYLRGGSLLDTYAEGALVNVIFCLEPSRNRFDTEGKQDIWLKVLHMEVVG